MVTIRFETDNAAFSDDWAGEIRRILHAAAAKVGGIAPDDSDSGPILDSNGNRVGAWSAERDAEESAR